ncbi:SDR family oxidoreductase [Herminiimonas fonticola]|uniref:NAD(P)-dependent dehydrogenase (Short-subunit alcohol dehydrogenase family) n=1 Tax=Herminiimonas fonticola TaxID=303380 RepID=A0A4R6G3E5_9BURK|nr:SDR family oxidoreductase [Herminiimonas fonticola]RBA23395.1 Dehydrogenases with different specificities (related to short-chain alcohol dehydrogenases) [Herminiimonas fonticola]TDN88350.1 NAD(P)-dependent dehydrogenase (short-subunit alcohol dehydrogenase family) [Herminiimonas fonticola]
MGIEVNFEGKVALITGASSGLGARFAKVLAMAGAQVVLAARRVDRLKELRAEIEAEGGAAHVVTLDVTDYASIKSAIAHAETEAGAIDILVNNAGVSGSGRLVDVTPEEYAFVMDTNQRGAFFVAQEVAKRMIARYKGDARKQHRIVNIASVAGLRVVPELGLYSMSKASVVHMTKSMAVEWGKFGINVNAICPGYIGTEMNLDYLGSEQGQQLINALPRKRVGKPEDLDGLLLLLAAEESHFINGAIMTADDGMSIA